MLFNTAAVQIRMLAKEISWNSSILLVSYILLQENRMKSWIFFIIKLLFKIKKFCLLILSAILI